MKSWYLPWSLGCFRNASHDYYQPLLFLALHSMPSKVMQSKIIDEKKSINDVIRTRKVYQRANQIAFVRKRIKRGIKNCNAKLHQANVEPQKWGRSLVMSRFLETFLNHKDDQNLIFSIISIAITHQSFIHSLDHLSPVKFHDVTLDSLQNDSKGIAHCCCRCFNTCLYNFYNFLQ